jgi:hypothetical protein
VEKKNNKKRLPQKKDEEITNQLFGENSPTNESFEKQKEMFDDGAEFTTAEIIDFSQGADS